MRRTFGATYLSEGSDFTIFKVTGIPEGLRGRGRGGGREARERDAPGGATKALTTEGSQHALEVRRGEETLRLDAVVKLVSIDD